MVLAAPCVVARLSPSGLPSAAAARFCQAMISPFLPAAGAGFGPVALPRHVASKITLSDDTPFALWLDDHARGVTVELAHPRQSRRRGRGGPPVLSVTEHTPLAVIRSHVALLRPWWRPCELDVSDPQQVQQLLLHHGHVLLLLPAGASVRSYARELCGAAAHLAGSFRLWLVRRAMVSASVDALGLPCDSGVLCHDSFANVTRVLSLAVLPKRPTTWLTTFLLRSLAPQQP